MVGMKSITGWAFVKESAEFVSKIPYMPHIFATKVSPLLPGAWRG